MKPATKKTIIIIAAVLIVALIVWLVFFRKKGWEKEIDNLDIADSYKEQLRKGVKQILADPLCNKKDLEASAASFGITYDQWLVLLAAQELGWTNGTTNGQIVVKPKD